MIEDQSSAGIVNECMWSLGFTFRQPIGSIWVQIPERLRKKKITSRLNFHRKGNNYILYNSCIETMFVRNFVSTICNMHAYWTDIELSGPCKWRQL